MFDVVAGADFQTRHLLLALRVGEPYRLARALAWQAAHISNLGGGQSRGAEKLLAVARSLAQRINHPHAIGMTTLSEGIAEFTAGRWKKANAVLEQAAGIMRDFCQGVAWEQDTAYTFALWSLFYMGELPEMGRRSALLLKEALARGDLYAATTLGTFTEAMTRLAADEPDAAEKMVDDYLGQWSQAGFHVQHMIALMSRTYIDLYCGRAEVAARRMNAQWPALKRSHLLVVQIIRILMHNLRARASVTAARTARDPVTFIKVAERDVRLMESERTPYGAALALGVRAALAALAGDKTGAASLFGESAAKLDDLDMRLFAAAARRRRGELLASSAGSQLAASADQLMRGQGVQNPALMAAALAPGI
jgi:hypothetical protein